MTESSVPQVFSCPSCGSPLPNPGDSATMVCSACGNTVVVPIDLRGGRANEAETQARKKAVLHELLRLVGNGEKIEAIKVYRKNFQVGLLEAKNAIDALEEGHGIDLPDPNPLPEPVQMPIIVQIPAQPEIQTAVARRKKGASCGVWLAILLMVGLSAAAWWVITLASSANGAMGLPAFLNITAIPKILARPPGLLDPAVLIPVDDGPADVVVQARHFDQDPYTTTLLRLSTKTGKTLWETEPFAGKDILLNEMYTDGLRVFVVLKDILSAYQAEDGKLLWQATLADKLGYCGENKACVLNYQSVVLVLSSDATLQALDAVSGKKLWDYRLNNSSDGIQLYRDQVMVIGQDSQTADDFIAFLNYKSGAEEMRVSPQNFYGSTDLFLDQDHLYLGESYTLEKWDLSQTAPALAWQTENITHSLSNKDFLGKEYLYFSESDSLNRCSLATGAVTPFLKVQDFELTPVAEQGDDLVVLARRSRGTEKFEIWLVNSKTAAIDNAIAIGEGTLYDGSYESINQADKFVWTWQIMNGKLVVVKFLGDPNQISIDHYNLISGAKDSNKVIPLSKIQDDSYAVRDLIGWKNGILWVMLNTEVYAIDGEQGALILSTP